MKKKIAHIRRHMRRKDPALFARMRKMELALPKGETDPALYFKRLCREIVSQQLGGKAADAIHKRFLGLFPKSGPTPRRVLALTEKRLRAVGMSWAKAKYLRALAKSVSAREVRLKGLHELDDEAVIRELTKIKGIGRWTAEMFLMFTLGREDVFSFGDLGLQKGLVLVYGSRRTRTKKSIEVITGAWAPYRSYGSLALWRLNDSDE